MSREILELPPPPADCACPTAPTRSSSASLAAGGDGPHPVVVLLHGGYWRARYGLEYFGHAAAALRDERLAVWNVEYRRLGNPGRGYPGTFLDVGRALDALRGLAERFPLDLGESWRSGTRPAASLALWAAGPSPAAGRRSARQPGPAAAGRRDRAGWRGRSAPRLGARLSDAVVNDLLGGSPKRSTLGIAAPRPSSCCRWGCPRSSSTAPTTAACRWS